MNDSDEDPWFRKYSPVLGGVALLSVMCGLGAYGLSRLGGGQPPAPPSIQEISIIQPPPPPPPPPKVEEPPPPEEVVDVPEPEPEPLADETADEPPPGEDLGLDADGVAGADGFGLKAKKGGRGLIGGGDAHQWYAGLLQKDIQSALAAVDEIRKGRYSVVVRIWVSPQGMIEDSELVRGSGVAEIDEALTRALAGGVRISSAPPDDLPQPIKLEITSRT